ncbi:MAG: bifunctional DNA primase/polymerase [Planctomycetota bacterium]|nr:bifunctional DNA primase/polymerase [Planctomycetota bacterium]
MNCIASTNRIKDELKTAAFFYAGEYGWPVFPCHHIIGGRCSCGQADCGSPGKHPRTAHGVKDASTEPEQIEKWWDKWPGSNIGIATGKTSGLTVLDLDPRTGAVLDCIGRLPETPRTSTGGGGAHLFFKYVEGRVPKMIAPGYDLKSDGGYVIGPPSNHISGGRYEWVLEPEVLRLADFPDRLLKKQQAKPGNNGTVTVGNASLRTIGRAAAYMANVPPAVEGNGGHDATFKAACRLVRDFALSVDQAMPLFLEWNRKCKPPWEDHELRKMLEHALEYGGGKDGTEYPIGRKVDPADSEADADDGPIIRPLPITELIDTDPIEWVCHPYLATGMITLFVALWKIGKTTLISHLARAMGGGGGFGGEVKQGRLLIVSEESPSMWKARQDELGIGSHVDLACRPFMHRPNSLRWNEAILEIAALVKARSYQVVIIDTLADLSPCDDENDASKVMESVKPLKQITDAGAALMLLHHPNKSDGGEAKASRGSGALPGFVDIIMEMRRFDALRHEDTRRVLKTYSRLDSGEQVLDLTPQGYICKGSKSDATRRARLETIDTILRSEAGKTVDQILEDWPEDQKPPYKPGLNKHLKYGIELKEWNWTRSGEGKKNDPFRYWRDKA